MACWASRTNHRQDSSSTLPRAFGAAVLAVQALRTAGGPSAPPISCARAFTGGRISAPTMSPRCVLVICSRISKFRARIITPLPVANRSATRKSVFVSIPTPMACLISRPISIMIAS
eukprot:scaffold114259_cov31-Tisochrysis_lutea.AAC.2